MIETLTIITLSVLFLIFFRPGKTPPLNNPLIIERPGQYHMTLMPQLNLAQPFIEAIAKQIGTISDAEYSNTQYFEVWDKQVTAHGHDCYMLAITQCNGMLYFQAASPQSADPSSHKRTMQEFADAVLERFHVQGKLNTALGEHIIAATQKTAQLCHVHIKQLGK